jgi:hypothetical protein
MKSFLILTLALFTSLAGFSQDYMDKIAEAGCNCITELPDSVSRQELNVKLGLCMIEAAIPYKKKLKKDYGIDFARIDEEGEKLGRIIGTRMASVCPMALIALSSKMEDEEIAAEEELPMEEVTENMAVGEVTQVDDASFVVFSVKDSYGKTYKYHWMSEIETDLDLAVDYASMMGKSVEITYETKSFFDPKIEDYRTFNVIKSMNLKE